MKRLVTPENKRGYGIHTSGQGRLMTNDLSYRALSNKVVSRLSKDQLLKLPLLTPGGIQKTYFVNEEGFYDVVFDSRKPVAKEFRKWVTRVIKSVNQTGAYVEPDQIEIKFNEYNNN